MWVAKTPGAVHCKTVARQIAVTVVEDQREVREGLCELIESAAGFSCTGSFDSMESTLRRLGPPLPDIVLLDIGLPGISGIEGARLLNQRFPALQILILTVYDDDRRIFEAMCAGACGYLLKTTPPERLVECLREVAAGGAPMSPDIARRVIALFRTIRPPDTAHYVLTDQEMRLLQLLGDGHQDKTAAAELNLSQHTVTFHLRSIYTKLQVHSRSEAVAKALRSGLIR